MPIYEYECKKCGNVQESFQKISDAPLKKCDRCGGELNKIVSHSSFHLKGSGWYVTDYGGTTSKNDKISQDKDSINKNQAICTNTCTNSCSSSTNKAE